MVTTVVTAGWETFLEKIKNTYSILPEVSGENIKQHKCLSAGDDLLRRTCVIGTEKPRVRSKIRIFDAKMLKNRKKSQTGSVLRLVNGKNGLKHLTN